jgi:hypothetical protein
MLAEGSGVEKERERERGVLVREMEKFRLAEATSTMPPQNGDEWMD